jgi:hypothetical protein
MFEGLWNDVKIYETGLGLSPEQARPMHRAGFRSPQGNPVQTQRRGRKAHQRGCYRGLSDQNGLRFPTFYYVKMNVKSDLPLERPAPVEAPENAGS